jgi:hypothetical protein
LLTHVKAGKASEKRVAMPALANTGTPSPRALPKRAGDDLGRELIIRPAKQARQSALPPKAASHCVAASGTIGLMHRCIRLAP